MKFTFDTFTVALLLLSNKPIFAHPQPITDIQLVTREHAETLGARDNAAFEDLKEFWKRKGGGGGGGKGGGKGGSSSSSSSSRYVPSSSQGNGIEKNSGVERARGVGSSTWSVQKVGAAGINTWTRSWRGGSSSSQLGKSSGFDRRFVSLFSAFYGGGRSSSSHGIRIISLFFL